MKLNLMKTTLLTLITSIAVASLGVAAEAEDKHGPKGGELLDAKPNPIEFILDDHKASIAFYDGAMKPVAAGDQTAVLWVESDGKRMKIEFEKKGDLLVAKQPLPEKTGEQMMLQIETTPDAKLQSIKIHTHHDEGHGEAEHKHGETGHKEGDGHDH